MTSISWNESPFEPAKIAVGTHSKVASIWTCDVGNKWREECILGIHRSHYRLFDNCCDYSLLYIHRETFRDDKILR